MVQRSKRVSMQARICSEYNEIPDEFYKIHPDQITLFRQLINKQFADLSNFIYFDFVDEDPYDYNSIAPMRMDYESAYIKVNTSGNESRLWGKVYNLMFRAIHDYFHCVYNMGFTFNEEYKVYVHQLELTMNQFMKESPGLDWELFGKVLRSEIVYQAAKKEITGEFHIEQKIILQDLL